MISQISSQRSRAGSGCGETHAGTAETDSSRTELMLAGTFAEPPYGGITVFGSFLPTSQLTTASPCRSIRKSLFSFSSFASAL
jgi:hypothetical protein